MRQAVVYDANDVKKLLAELHHVKTENVIKNQYSYTVVLEDEKGTHDEDHL